MNAQTTTATDLVNERRIGGQAVQPVDESAVEMFLKGAEGQPAAKIAVVIEKMLGNIRRGERARGPQGFVSLETIAAAADRLADLIA